MTNLYSKLMQTHVKLLYYDLHFHTHQWLMKYCPETQKNFFFAFCSWYSVNFIRVFVCRFKIKKWSLFSRLILCIYKLMWYLKCFWKNNLEKNSLPLSMFVRSITSAWKTPYRNGIVITWHNSYFNQLTNYSSHVNYNSK